MDLVTASGRFTVFRFVGLMTCGFVILAAGLRDVYVAALFAGQWALGMHGLEIVAF